MKGKAICVGLYNLTANVKGIYKNEKIGCNLQNNSDIYYVYNRSGMEEGKIKYSIVLETMAI